MPLFNRLFKKNQLISSSENSTTEFGRFLTCNLNQSSKEKYIEAVALYEKGDYLSSFEKLLNHFNSYSHNNVEQSFTHGSINFNIRQGCQIVSGEVNNEDFYAYSSIGSYEEPNISLFRHLLTRNHNLQYCAFAIRNKEIIIRASTKTYESSPEKLFFILKELAVTADTESDAFADEFPFLNCKQHELKLDISDKEKKVKTEFLKKWIGETLRKISELDTEKEVVLITSALLTLIYRIDILLVPYGEVRRKLYKALRYYSKQNHPLSQKIEIIKSIINDIYNSPEKELQNCFYKQSYTFGVIEATSHKQLYEFILKQFDVTGKLYIKSNDKEFLKWMYEYIVGYCMYYFGVLPATKKIMLIIYRVLFPDFFTAFGYKELYDTANKSFNKTEIERELSVVIVEEREDYPQISIVHSNISYNSIPSFMKSLLNEITYLNFSRPTV